MTDETNWTGGYGTPPHQHRFKKGQSGNPGGRKAGPKRVEAIGDRVMRGLYEEVAVMVRGKKCKMPAIEGIMLRGRALALTSDRLLDINRYIENARKMGFDFHLEEAAARTEERRQYEAALDEQARAMAMCHEALYRSATEIETLRETIAALRGQAPEAGQPLE